MITLKITVAMDAVKTGTTEANVHTLSNRERLMIALKAMSITWGIAFLCILIPVFHFILVPAFLLAGIVMFFIQHRRTEFLEQATVKCPECANVFELKNISFNWPLRQICPKCQMVLLFES